MLNVRTLPLAIFFILIAVSSRASVLLDKVVAVVNQEVITWSELYKSMESEASPQLKQLDNAEKMKIFKENESSFLDTLINVKLQLQEAKNLGIGVSDEEVRESIDNIKKKYSMTDSSFLDSLKKEGLTFEEYAARLRDQIIISKVVNQQIRSKILVSDRDVQKFIRDNEKGLEWDGGYRISQIFFKEPASDEERIAVEKKASEVLKKLKEGADFSELARQYSEDPSAASGGDLGRIGKAQMAKEFVDAIAKMQPGEVSAPFWTARGLHIIRLNKVIPAKNTAQIKEEAKTALSKEIFEERYSTWIKGLREKAYIEIRL